LNLTLSPQTALPGQPETTILVDSDTITIDGVPYDLSSIEEGGAGYPEGRSPFIGPIRRFEGTIHAKIVVRLGSTAASRQPTNPEYWMLHAASGFVPIPALRKTSTAPEDAP